MRAQQDMSGTRGEQSSLLAGVCGLRGWFCPGVQSLEELVEGLTEPSVTCPADSEADELGKAICEAVTAAVWKMD